MFFGPTFTLHLVTFLIEIQTLAPCVNRVSGSFISRIFESSVLQNEHIESMWCTNPVPQVATKLVLQIGSLNLS